MKDFSEKQRAAAQQIISAGLKKAAESLSFFMKEGISLREIGYYDNWGDPTWEPDRKENPNIHLLVTEVIGELKGMCCLIFTEKEADQLRQTALPPEILANQQMMAEMSDAIMLEVDNIISASVITQFSNLLKHKIYGGVPSLQKINFEQLTQFISDESAKGMFVINFKTNFLSAKGNFSPEFLWLFDNTFVQSIRRYADTQTINA